MLRYRTGAVRRLFEASFDCGSRQHARADKTPRMGGGKLIFHVQRGGARWRDDRRRSTGRRAEHGPMSGLSKGQRPKERLKNPPPPNPPIWPPPKPPPPWNPPPPNPPPELECQGGTAHGQRRAQRGRCRQYAEPFHIRPPPAA